MIYIILAILHLLVCLCVAIGLRREVLSLHKYMFFIVLFLPFWGALIAVVLHFQIAFDANDSADIEVESLKLESELYRSIEMDEKRSDRMVPLEEALLINSARERRALIMDVLNDNPSDYIEFLQTAGNNDDTEVVHYAVTAMVEISKENDSMLQKLEAEYKENPDDIGTLSRYCDFLWNCLSQNLMQGQVEVMNRELFSELMYKKMMSSDNVQDYARFVENELRRKSYNTAAKVLKKMEERWQGTEEYIILNLQYLASVNKGKEIREFIKKIKNEHVYLTPKTKEALAFWEN